MFADSYTGYLRSIDTSFCMDECSLYYLESEEGEFLINVADFNDPVGQITGYSLNLDQYLNRYIYIEGEEVWCVECGALLISSIYLSSDCEYPVYCFADPCQVAEECQLSTPVDCVSNYCDGCYADFYDLEGNLVDCYTDEQIYPCHDIENSFFGICDMFLGYAVVNGICDGVSGCGWEIDGIDYTNAFFDTFEDCEENCLDEPYICEDIENDYDQYHSGGYIECEYDNDCIAVWGHCDVGLGGCHYSVNENNYPEDEINNLVDMWLDGNCMQWVCDCSAEPYAQCIDETCTSAYCMSDNPAGCYQTGCNEGYECLDDTNYCVPSTCGCDGFYGDWICTEDCGGGTCAMLGDINYDGVLNIIDVVSIVSVILQASYNVVADINQDNSLNVIDIVILVNLILGE